MKLPGEGGIFSYSNYYNANGFFLFFYFDFEEDIPSLLTEEIIEEDYWAENY